MYYTSKLTKFTAGAPPLTDKIYYKDGNKTVAIIYVDNEWNMHGVPLDPYDLPISPLKPIYTELNQKQCELMLLKDTPPPNRKDIIDYYGDKVIDYSKILYSTRLINLLTHYWVAWSEDDKAEDYHPLFNKDIMKRRMNSYIKLDWEPEDDEESQPYCEFDFEKDNMFYREPIDLTDATFE